MSSPASLPPDAEQFLRTLRQGLSSLAPAERDDLVSEVRAHLLDRRAAGHPDVLAGFESPDALAASYVAECALRGALARGTSVALGRALLVAARDSVLALLVLVPLVLLQLLAVGLLLVSVIKIFDPGPVGLWVGPGNVVIGMTNDPSLHEVLGFWATPVLFLSGVLILVTSNRAMRALVRWRLRTRSGLSPSAAARATPDHSQGGMS